MNLRQPIKNIKIKKQYFKRRINKCSGCTGTNVSMSELFNINKSELIDCSNYEPFINEEINIIESKINKNIKINLCILKSKNKYLILKDDEIEEK